MKKAVFVIAGILTFWLATAQVKYEFRGVWIATVANIDWPSSQTLSVAEQKTSFIRMVDMHKTNGINTIVMQIRPTGDAFYPSTLEPWSHWLTGQQGRAPHPFYDPLEFMIEETHKRGMEFHAWLNPYRVSTNATSRFSAGHIYHKHPDWFITYDKKRFFDPGNKDAQKFVLEVVRDIVKRYDIDAIHMDDYFYPYPADGKDFPDQRSYQLSGSQLPKDAWRRSNVDSIILAISNVIKFENPFCKFGISPFGVWRNQSKDPRGSNTKAGVTNYDDLHADILLWLKMGWIDYVTPQLYWERGHKLADYDELLEWWGNNSYGRHVYIGHGLYRAGSNNAWKNPNEIPEQIKLARKNPNIQGSLFYSSKSFNNNPNGWNDSLKNNYYHKPAIIPPMKWIDSLQPVPPSLTQQGQHWQVSNPDTVEGFHIAVYAFNKNEPSIPKAGNLWFIHTGTILNIRPADFLQRYSFPAGVDRNNYKIAVSVINRSNNESVLVSIPF